MQNSKWGVVPWGYQLLDQTTSSTCDMELSVTVRQSQIGSNNHELIDDIFVDWAIGEAFGPDKFDLLSPECPPDWDDTASTCSSTDSEGSNCCPVEFLSAVTVPQFDKIFIFMAQLTMHLLHCSIFIVFHWISKHSMSDCWTIMPTCVIVNQTNVEVADVGWQEM